FHDERGSGEYGAILFDSTQLRQVDPRWFDPLEWGSRAQEVGGSGRGGAWFIEASHGPLVLRQYLRGGMAARFSRDRYLWRGAHRTRGFAEFRLLRELLRRKCPVPVPVAACYLRGRATYRAAGGALPPRGAGPRRPQCPQHPVRLRRKGLDDRLRPLPHAHPGHRLARAQPGAAAAIAAQAGGAGGPRGGRCRLRAPAPGLRRALGPGDLTMAAVAAPAWALRFQGVGNASATELGTPMATIERAGAPWLTIDCGSEGLSAYLDHYGEPPRAIFVTHVHLDHVGGFERLFVSEYFDPARRGRM